MTTRSNDTRRRWSGCTSPASSISGVALVAITLIIPLGVFMRYVDEQPAVLAGAGVRHHDGDVLVPRRRGGVPRQRAHRGRGAAQRREPGHATRACCGASTRCMAAIALFMLGYGIQLCLVTRFSTMAEFPWLSVAFVYMPIPVGGLFTLLFLIERVWVGDPPPTSIMYRDQATELE